MGDLTTTTANPAGALSGTDRLIGAQGSADVYFSLAALATYITALISDSAPGTLDTLNELAAALGDDPNFATTMATALAGKQPLDSDLTAIAALTTTAWGRALLTLADSAAARAVIEIEDRRVIVPVDGGTTNIAASTAKEIVLFINHTATIASHTFNLPALLDGQKVSIRVRSAITSVSLVAASGTILSNLSSYSASGHATWEYLSSAGLYFRCE